jgi:cysteinyl-tRNA synthetase
LFELVRELNAGIEARGIGRPDADVIREAFDEFDRVLGIMSLRRAEEAAPPIPEAEIAGLIEERRLARHNRQFARADAIRADLESRGIILEDSTAGTRWKRK